MLVFGFTQAFGFDGSFENDTCEELHSDNVVQENADLTPLHISSRHLLDTWSNEATRPSNES